MCEPLPCPILSHAQPHIGEVDASAHAARPMASAFDGSVGLPSAKAEPWIQLRALAQIEADPVAHTSTPKAIKEEIRRVLGDEAAGVLIRFDGRN